MGRPKLNMSPEERSEHDRRGNNRRKQDQRKRDADAKALGGRLCSAEIDGLVEMLTSMSLAEAAFILAELQRDYKKTYGIEIPGLREASSVGYRSEDESSEDYDRRKNRATKLGLIRHFATNAIQRSKARARSKKFELNEEHKAAELGIDVQSYREWKRAKNKSSKRQEEIAKTMELIQKNR
ncbi:hypothetical protein [Ochrobactrum quorumnocens]|uniref:Uncharacterized protein n=1 Tax=Ochrobactrum quorumnocens TaxID=271865 RepID=A0A5N1JPN6_9HYPH|nr:hypothetical protein [[Ochrobactrum] quorumnocens]KAA9366147.1 hypothetical protein F3W84_17995 [[Ochrobactrum] quorumnocens]